MYRGDTTSQSHTLFLPVLDVMSMCNALSYSVDPCTDLACSVEGSESYPDHISACTGYPRGISLREVSRKSQSGQSLMAPGLSDNLLGYLKESGGDKLWSMVTMRFFHFRGLVT